MLWKRKKNGVISCCNRKFMIFLCFTQLWSWLAQCFCVGGIFCLLLSTECTFKVYFSKYWLNLDMEFICNVWDAFVHYVVNELYCYISQCAALASCDWHKGWPLSVFFFAFNREKVITPIYEDTSSKLSTHRGVIVHHYRIQNNALSISRKIPITWPIVRN